MRNEVMAALDSLSDPARQRRWGVWVEGVNYYDDLDLNVHILYDDCRVLPDPDSMIGSVLADSAEADALRPLHRVLWPMIEDLGNRPDEDYLADPRWPQVTAAARDALAVFRRNT